MNTIAERRSEKRIPIELDVRVESEATSFDTLSGDLSPGGMFVTTPRDNAALPKPGSHVMITFTLRDGGRRDELAVVAVVKWRRVEHDVPGMGLAFFGLDPTFRDALDRFCSVRVPLYEHRFESDVPPRS